jgi:type IV pilus assembly protein PilA
MAVAMPLYLSAVADAQKKTCRANMQTIANAVQAARIKSGASDYSALITGGVTVANLPDLLAVPVCPNSGTYSLANGNSNSVATFLVSCSYGTGATAHGTFQPGVNFN